MAFFSLVERLAKRALNASGVHSRYADTSIAKLHVYDAPGRGDLPAVVVLHGISSSAAAYGPLIQKLRSRVRRVIAPDAPGHGLSGDPRAPLNPESLFASLTEALDAHIDEPAVVFGCSLGGAMAINYALERAGRVRGLMLASPAGATMDANELERFLKTFQLTSRADASDFMARLYHRAPWYTPLIASELQKLFARPVITSFTSSVRPEHLFTAEKVGSLTMPVHLIWGRSDRLMPPSNLEFYRKSLPGHTVIEEPEGMGHCPHLDNPAALADTICAFARKVAEGSATGARMSA
jgi:pimeloyl-ACP methyl ester carboxylesterase